MPAEMQEGSLGILPSKGWENLQGQCMLFSSLTLKVVVIWVLCHPAIQKGPGEVVHSILLVLNGLGDNLSIEVVMHTVVQVRLYRQWLIQKFFEKILWIGEG